MLQERIRSIKKTLYWLKFVLAFAIIILALLIAQHTSEKPAASDTSESPATFIQTQ